MKIQNAKNLKRTRAIIMAHAVSAFILMLFTCPVLAQDDEGNSTDSVPGLDLFDEDVERTRKGWPQLYVAAGIMYLNADGIYSIRFPDGNDVTVFDFDRAGLKDHDYSYWFAVNWRSPGSRWGAWFGSWRYDVSSSGIWQDKLELSGGKEIPVGADVTSEFVAQWYILEATYSFYRSETVDSGIGFGFHAVDLDTTITAHVEVGDRETAVISENLDILAPLPNVLVYVSWKFAPKWMLNTRVGYFTLDYDKYSGAMINAHVMLNYSLSPRWALGVGYQFVDLDLEVDKIDRVQVYDIKFDGPMAYARFRF